MTTDRPTGDLGRKLREARERKGVTLRQIANSTKISIAVLESIERNDVSKLPGGIFGRAFVRSFATEVGLDPEVTIQEFIAQFRDDSVSAGHPPSEQTEDNESLESNRRMASAFLRLIALSIPIAGVILYFGVAGRRVVPAAAPPAAAAATTPATLASSTTTADQEPADTAAPGAAEPLPPASSDRLAINISVTRPCWVAAIVDGERQIERLMQPGDAGTLDVRRELVLTAGDAGALTMTINGIEARPFGKVGAVVTARVNLSNFQTFLPER